MKIGLIEFKISDFSTKKKNTLSTRTAFSNCKNYILLVNQTNKVNLLLSTLKKKKIPLLKNIFPSTSL